MVECGAFRQEQLPLLPLEEITERWGEHGLRARFAFEIRRFPDDDQVFINGALELASFLHGDERRVREPYINHVLRVTLRVLHDGEFTDVDVIVASILHDTVENHHDKLIQEDSEADIDPEAFEVEMLHAMALDILQTMFNERAASLVNVLTNPPLDPDMPREQRHELYRINVIEKLRDNPEARPIKICDVLDNTADLELIYTKNPSKAVALAKKYQPMIIALIELTDRDDTPLSDQAKQHLALRLEESEERCRRIIEIAY